MHGPGRAVIAVQLAQAFENGVEFVGLAQADHVLHHDLAVGRQGLEDLHQSVGMRGSEKDCV